MLLMIIQQLYIYCLGSKLNDNKFASEESVLCRRREINLSDINKPCVL